MRVIVNLHSNHIADKAGWRARPIEITGKNESILKEILDTIVFENGTSLFNLIIKENRLDDRINLYVNGARMPSNPDLNLKIKDNVQIHVMNRPGK